MEADKQQHYCNPPIKLSGSWIVERAYDKSDKAWTENSNRKPHNCGDYYDNQCVNAYRGHYCQQRCGESPYGTHNCCPRSDSLNRTFSLRKLPQSIRPDDVEDD